MLMDDNLSPESSWLIWTYLLLYFTCSWLIQNSLNKIFLASKKDLLDVVSFRQSRMEVEGVEGVIDIFLEVPFEQMRHTYRLYKAQANQTFKCKWNFNGVNRVSITIHKITTCRLTIFMKLYKKGENRFKVFNLHGLVSWSSGNLKIMNYFFASIILCSFVTVFGQYPINGTCPEICKPFDLNVTLDQVRQHRIWLFFKKKSWFFIPLCSYLEFGSFKSAFLIVMKSMPNVHTSISLKS